MTEKINIAEILKDCPKGMELNCVLFENVTFEGIKQDQYPIIVKIKEPPMTLSLTKTGGWNSYNSAKCVIYPKGKTTWEGFVPPYSFNDGDIVATTNGLFVGIVEVKNNKPVGAYCSIDYVKDFRINSEYMFDRLATPWEKEKLFQAIKNNGYRWNPETKTLEKVIQPKFKVGDKVKRKDADYTYTVTITKLDDDYYDYVNEDGQCGVIHISAQNNWELVPSKFDITTLVPFESRVLMRSSNAREWVGTIYSHYNNNYFFGCGMMCQQCIPYEGNEHLLGTTNDCDEYYKTW